MDNVFSCILRMDNILEANLRDGMCMGNQLIRLRRIAQAYETCLWFIYMRSVKE